MRVKFKNGSVTYECTEPIEQKVFRSGEAVGWAVMFHIYGDFDSSEIDRVVTPETVSELVFANEDQDGTEFTISGYSAVTSCVIRHRASSTVSELQLTKQSTAQTVKSAKGAAENG